MRIAAVVAVSGTLLLASVSARQARMPFVPMGVWYGGGTASPPLAPRNPPANPAAWREDLQKIRALGFNTVTTWVDWAGAEPQRGHYRFDALDRMLALAGETGLRVIVQLFVHVPPDWIGRQYPDAAPTGGATGAKEGEQSGACLDHPGVGADLAAFIAAVSTRAAGHEAFYALDLGSAARSHPAGTADSSVQPCVCAYTLRGFRDWLQRRYGTLDALNGAWAAGFETWAQVEPRGGRAARSFSRAVDWETFAAVKRQEDLRFMVRASAPRGAHPTTSHSNVPTIVATPDSGTLDDWWKGSRVDYYGTAIFPRAPAAGPSWPPATLGAALDGIRSATRDRGWWLSELQAGQSVAGVRVGEPVTAADVRLWGWAALSRGARALSYFAWYPMSGGVDAHGYGMLDLDGRLTDRARAAGRLAGIVARNPALFAPLRPRAATVAILYNDSQCLTRFMATACAAARASMLGFYRAMFERNIPVDFVHADEIVAGRASAYRAVFMGSNWLLPESVADALAVYVRSGGTLISEARPGWTDAVGRASPRIPGLGLDELFGAREKLVHDPGPFEIVMERELDGSLSPLAGRTLPGKGVAEHLEISGTNVRVVARFPGDGGAPGDPAIVMSRHETGRAILIGSFPAAAFEEDPVQFRSSGDLLAALAAGAGVKPEVQISGGEGVVEARFLESSAATVLVAINHSAAPRKVRFDFSAETPEAIWLNLETGMSVHFVARPGGPSYTHTFGPRDVLALMIKNDLR